MKALRFGGTCSFCGETIEKRERGWHDGERKIVRCLKCGVPEDSISAVNDQLKSDDPVAGSSALRDGRIRNDVNLRKGAVGEYVTGHYLFRNLPPNCMLLNDRRVPGTNANIDHVVVSPSGVWVVDSKNWSGKIEYNIKGLGRAGLRLYADGNDRTNVAEKLYELVIPIAQIIGDPSVDIHPALCFVNPSAGLAWGFRQKFMTPDKHMGVWLTNGLSLVKLITRPGVLEDSKIKEVVHRLNLELRPR